MKLIEVDEDVYESLRREAEERKVTVGDIVREKVEPKKPWRMTPVDMGGDFLIPPERWREAEDEGRVP